MWRKNSIFLAISMHPTLDVYYDPNRLPLPPVVGWLEALGLSAIHRTPEDAPAEWLERYGCCFPWVVANGRLVLKAGFQRAQLERLVLRWYGAPLLIYYPWKQCRTPERASQSLGCDPAPHSHHPQNPIPVLPYRQNNSNLPNLQLQRIEAGEDSALSEILLRSFRSGWRPVIVWVDSSSPPPVSLLSDYKLSDKILTRALEQLTVYDLVLFRKSTGEPLLLGLRAWHGALFGDNEAIGLDVSYLMARAEELELKSIEIEVQASEVNGFSIAETLPVSSNAAEPKKDRS